VIPLSRPDVGDANHRTSSVTLACTQPTLYHKQETFPQLPSNTHKPVVAIMQTKSFALMLKLRSFHEIHDQLTKFKQSKIIK
jgi:hypothetical protein